MGREGRFLVIGGAGLVGRHLVLALAGRSTIATYHRNAPSGAISLDITNAREARRVVSETAPDVIILAAADAWVEHCERAPEESRRVNVDAARAIAEASHDVGALMVVFSSEYVFDGTAGECSEDDSRHPLNEYGRQKVALEDIALAHGHGLVCRTSAVFGVDPNRKNFVCQLEDSLRARRPFDVPSDQFVTPTYAPALANAVVALSSQSATGTFHVAGPRVMSRVEFATTIADAYELDRSLIRPRPTDELGLRARRPLRCGLRTDKLARTLGHGLTPARAALAEMAAMERGRRLS